MMRSSDIHARIDWPAVLVNLGLSETSLKNKHGPCPGCGGKDCFRFDHAKRGNGSFYCNKFGSGDGFKLLEHVYGWPFAEARKRVIEAAGLVEAILPRQTAPPLRTRATEALAAPSVRVLRLRRDRCAIEDCDDVVDYLASRGLWPLAPGCTLKAHATVEYWHESQRVGRFPAIVADVVDVAGELVTVHATYLQVGKKIEGYEPRKILSPMTGREGCAVRLMPMAETLGIAEGIETALSASMLDDVPVWAALNTSLLSKFEPPPGVVRLRIYADRDEPGLEAACRLMERLQGRIAFEMRVPPAPSKDWNDFLITKTAALRGKGPNT